MAFVFASFLIGLGSQLVGDLPRVQAPVRLEDFVDQTQAAPLRARLKALEGSAQDAQQALEQAQLQRSKARSESQMRARLTPTGWPRAVV